MGLQSASSRQVAHLGQIKGFLHVVCPGELPESSASELR